MLTPLVGFLSVHTELCWRGLEPGGSGALGNGAILGGQRFCFRCKSLTSMYCEVFLPVTLFLCFAEAF